jgi:RNA polymerase sigma-70 factor (ECF subfamily)
VSPPSVITPGEFEDLHRATAPDVLAYLRRRGAREASAADLLSEVYLRAWRRRATLPRARWKRRAWLFRAARLVLMEHHRHASQAREALHELGQGGDPAESSPSSVARDRAVRAAIDALPEVDRELLTLTVWDGLSVAEAAIACGLVPGTARVRLHRARRRLAADPGLQALVTKARPPRNDGDRSGEAGRSVRALPERPCHGGGVEDNDVREPRLTPRPALVSGRGRRG